VREVVLRGALVDTEKIKIKTNTLFFILFPGVMGTVLDDCDIH
jgi:hypothetical protein